MDSSDSGKRLRELREASGQSRSQVGRKAGLTSSELSLWESGVRAVPRTERVQVGLSKAFGVLPLDLLGYLRGDRTLEDLLPPTTFLQQALVMGRPDCWLPATIQTARQLEASGVRLSILDWVRQLDYLDEEQRVLLKAAFERLSGRKDEPTRGY